jgi:hypothetical protein
MSAQSKWAHAYAEAAELAAEVRKQAQTNNDIEARRLQKNAAARHDLSDTAGALIAYCEACGYAPEVRHVLFAVMHASNGSADFERCPDWLMGYFLRGGGDDDLARLYKLPNDSTEKNRLKAAWRRARGLYIEEQRRTGYVSLRRKGGGKDPHTHASKRSEIAAPFLQHLVEIKKMLPAKCRDKNRPGSRAFSFKRAAETYVHDKMNCHPETEEERTQREGEESEARSERDRRRAGRAALRQPDTPALKVVRFIEKATEKIRQIEMLALDLLDDVPEEMRAEAYEHIAARFRQKQETDDANGDFSESVTPMISVGDTEPEAERHFCVQAKTENSDIPLENGKVRLSDGDKLSLSRPCPTAPSATYETYQAAIDHALEEKQARGRTSEDARAEVVAEIGEFDDWLERVNSYSRGVSHTCPSPDVDPELITERVYIMCEAGDISETEAAQIARRDLCEVCAEAANIARSHVTELEYAPGKFM